MTAHDRAGGTMAGAPRLEGRRTGHDGDPSALFSATYAEARERFVAAAVAGGFRHEAVTHPVARGAAGESLAIDFARLGPPRAQALLLISSGIHGVEGFCGSACQLALMRDTGFRAAVERAGVALLLVHAVNPYGFSHLRRANEDNVDLNRNFRDFATPAPANPGYVRMHPYLLPPSWPPGIGNLARLLAVLVSRGLRAFQTAVSSGQYAIADGLFYGGRAPTWSNRVLRDALRRHAEGCARLGWIDLHTGLGPAGRGEKIWAGRDSAADIARARAWWGPEVTSVYDGSSTSAALSGIVQFAAYDECPEAEFTTITLEFGTRSLYTVFAALRAEQWLHNHPEAPAARRERIKAGMRDAFHVDTPEWKSAVVPQARAAALDAVRGLAGGG